MNLLLLMLMLLLILSSSSATLESQKSIYLLHVDRANQRIGLRSPGRTRVPFKVDGQPLDWLPVCTKTVRFIAPKGPVIPNDPYGKYCESPPADGKNGCYYKVGPIEEIEKGSLDFGFYKIRITGKPADQHGRTGLLIHGGGKNLPNPLADFQGWQCTHGCIRMQNALLKVLVDTLRSLPHDSEVRLIIDGGKSKMNDIIAETYRWDEKTRDWTILDGGNS
ncbi:MAG TPA: L,D-transpeptidase family protein [Armatimonadota bacterium]|nr:L,D-transpeptidase family protein [Armatimonadota bacterium]